MESRVKSKMKSRVKGTLKWSSEEKEAAEKFLAALKK